MKTIVALTIQWFTRLGQLENAAQHARQFGSPGVTFVVSYLDKFEDALAGCRIGTDYPSSIMDHRQAREEYLALGKQQGTR